MKTIRWGIIGCGEVTEAKSGPALQQARNSELVAVMRRNGELAEDYARRHHVSKWYNNADELINDPEVSAVYIATPPGSHLEYTIKAARAKKPVYVEKPMARNYQECLQMIDVCRLEGVPLFVAYYRRTLPRFLKVKELVESGILGEIRLVSTILHQSAGEDLDHLWRLDPKISGGSRFVDMTCHLLDLLDYILGPIVTVRGTASNQAGLYRLEDTVTGQFTFKSGVEGVGAWCFASFGTYDQTEIIGSKGKLSFSAWNDGPICLTTTGGCTEFEIGYSSPVQLPLIQTVVDQLNGEGYCPSTGETGARTCWVMDQFLDEYRAKYY